MAESALSVDRVLGLAVQIRAGRITHAEARQALDYMAAETDAVAAGEEIELRRMVAAETRRAVAAETARVVKQAEVDSLIESNLDTVHDAIVRRRRG